MLGNLGFCKNMCPRLVIVKSGHHCGAIGVGGRLDYWKYLSGVAIGGCDMKMIFA